GAMEDVSEVPAGLVDRLRHYFLSYKQIPGQGPRKVRIAEVYGRAEAVEAIRRSIDDYREKFGDPAERMRRLRQLLGEAPATGRGHPYGHRHGGARCESRLCPGWARHPPAFRCGRRRGVRAAGKAVSRPLPRSGASGVRRSGAMRRFRGRGEWHPRGAGGGDARRGGDDDDTRRGAARGGRRVRLPGLRAPPSQTRGADLLVTVTLPPPYPPVEPPAPRVELPDARRANREGIVALSRTM